MTADVICVKISIYIRNISLIRVGIRFKYDYYDHLLSFDFRSWR